MKDPLAHFTSMTRQLSRLSEDLAPLDETREQAMQTAHLRRLEGRDRDYLQRWDAHESRRYSMT